MKKSIKILAVGNSFSVDGMEYLWNILREGGYDEVVLGNLAIGGCTVDMHADNIILGAPLYQYGKNISGEWKWEMDKPFLFGLMDEEWDVVTLQQASGYSGLPHTYARKDEIIAYLFANMKNKNAKIYWHMTWAYDADSPHIHFDFYKKDQNYMYNAIVEAVKERILTDKSFAGVIPSGAAIQNLRQEVKASLTKDSFHLTDSLGRYTAALTWGKCIASVSPENISWMPKAYEDEIKPVIDKIRKAVICANI